MSTAGPTGPPGFGEPTPGFLSGGRLANRQSRAAPADIRGSARTLAAFTAGELSEEDNILTSARMSSRRNSRRSTSFVRLVVADVDTGVIFGGGTLHHLDPERSLIEIGYWLFPRARGRGIATKVARVSPTCVHARHPPRRGLRRGRNVQSERVLERAGFTREGVIRSMPKSDGRRVDKTLFSLLPGE